MPADWQKSSDKSKNTLCVSFLKNHRSETNASLDNERLRKGLEQQLKEMQVRLDEAEAAALV